MSKKHLLAAVALCAFACSASAREAVLSVDSLLHRVAAANADVKAARSEYQATLQGIAVAESAKLPTLSASLNLNYLGDGTILDRDFSNAMRDKLPHFGNTLNVNLYQPIYTGGAITAAIDLAKLTADLAEIGIERQADISGFEALARYLSLMKMRNLKKVYAENLALTRRLIENMEERHQMGTALKNDVTRYELRLSSLTYDSLSIDNSISILNLDLATLLGYGPDTELIPSEITEMPSLLPESWWMSTAEGSSLELRSIDKSELMAHAGLKLEKAATRPSLGIVIGDQLTGPVTFEIPAINKNYNAWFAGVSIKYDISSLWHANKKVKQKRLEILSIADKRDAASLAIERNVHQAYTSMLQARQMLDTEELNVRLANENYDVVQTRFENDMALLTDILDASTAKLDAETRLVNARIDLLMSFYKLRFVSGILNSQL
ncbi:MAG: TolC family protein [Clostridium sp.]|nr:TolC family protein [Clostridium sp.]